MRKVARQYKTKAGRSKRVKYQQEMRVDNACSHVQKKEFDFSLSYDTKLFLIYASLFIVAYIFFKE